MALIGTLPAGQISVRSTVQRRRIAMQESERGEAGGYGAPISPARRKLISSRGIVLQDCHRGFDLSETARAWNNSTAP